MDVYGELGKECVVFVVDLLASMHVVACRLVWMTSTNPPIE